MAQERLSMRKIKEVLRLKYDCGLSHRQIAVSCQMAPRIFRLVEPITYETHTRRWTRPGQAASF
jgi:hypothetical protein